PGAERTHHAFYASVHLFPIQRRFRRRHARRSASWPPREVRPERPQLQSAGEKVEMRSSLDTRPFLTNTPNVLRRISHALVLCALLTAIGAHWAVLQSVAWTTMLAENLRTTSLP